MPKIGLSQMFVAKYSEDGNGTVTYKEGRKYGRARSFSTSITTSDNNNYNADNGIAESEDGVFTGGTIDITVAEVLFDIEKYIHGITEVKTEIDGETFTEIQYGDNTSSPYVGWGCVQKKRVHGKDYYNGLVLTKLAFRLNDEETDTQEESINWQDDTKTATIMKDDSSNHNWKRKSDDYETEAEAVAYVKAVLGIKEEEITA